MRTTDFGPEDARAGDTLCEAPHPFHDLSPDLTCLRPLGHEWEHATQLRGRRADDHPDIPLLNDWVWWADPSPMHPDAERSRLEASAYVAAGTAKVVAQETALHALGRRLRRTVAIVVVTVLLSIYCSAWAFSRFVTECYQYPNLSETRAFVCDHVFAGDVKVRPGPGRSYQPKNP